MTAIGVILICAAVLAALVLICAVCLWWDRNGENKSYDERQLLEQGRARAVADTVGMTYFFLLMALLSYEDNWLMQNVPVYLLILIGLLIQVLTYLIYCVMTHAALPFGQKPVSMILLSIFWGVVQFGNYFTSHRNEGLLSGNGIGLLNLIAGTGFFFLALIHLIALLRKERE